MTDEPRRTVMGVHASRPRPTRAGALWAGCALALPVGLVLGALEIVWRVVP
jgi:hypothetical protein